MSDLNLALILETPFYIAAFLSIHFVTLFPYTLYPKIIFFIFVRIIHDTLKRNLKFYVPFKSLVLKALPAGSREMTGRERDKGETAGMREMQGFTDYYGRASSSPV